MAFLEDPTCLIWRKGKWFAEGAFLGLHYDQETSSLPFKPKNAFVGDSILWYEQLGNVHVDVVENMAEGQPVRGTRIVAI